MTDRTDVKRPLRVLIVGAGLRVQNNFLPALRCLGESFEIVGLHARTEERMLPVAARWGVPAVPKLHDLDLAGVDVVALSVPTSQNAPVMEQLASQAWRLTLVIDTPIAFNRKELAVVTPLLQKFRRVAVAEDYMNFPHFALIRKVVREGLIGKPLAATLYNVGYAYHGLALIRSFVGFRSAIRSWRNPVGAFGRHVNYRFADGFRAFVIGPYRREGNGGIIVEGSRGVITEVASDRIGGDPMHRPIFRISKIYHNDFVSGFSVDDGARRLDRIDNPEIAMMREMDFADKSEFNLLKCCGLIAVFRSLIEPDPINSNYGYPNALYDSFAARLADRGRLIFDPLVLIRKNLMIGVHAVSRILSSASRLKGARGISS